MSPRDTSASGPGWRPERKSGFTSTPAALRDVFSLRAACPIERRTCVTTDRGPLTTPRRELAIPATAEVGFYILERPPGVVRIPCREMAGDVRGADVFRS